MSSKMDSVIKGLGPFENERLFPGCTDPTAASLFPQAIADVRSQLGRTYALFVDGKDITTASTIDSVNPAQPDEIIGRICQASCQDVEDAVQAANTALPAWRGTPASERAMYLVKCAAILRKDIYRFSAWQVLEEGKQWAQAYNDLAEAIDFLEYYAREIIHLAQPQDMGSYATETNHYFYEPKGIAAVISPWNFPLAIGVGMVSAAIVAGCPVVFKPSNQSPVVGHHLVQLFKEVGLPKGVFNFVPGRGSEMGDYLVDHPLVTVIAFTGSMEVGLRIIDRAGKTPENQVSVKKVICEMGGKNAVVIDNDTDIESAVPQVLYSAFGYQGQKCSACSRLIVLDEIYDAFVEKLIEQAKALKVAPAENPESYVGPVIDASAQKSILGYVDLAEKEGKLLYKSPVPDTGYYVPITITEGITPESRLAQEEVFGPVLAVMRAKNFDQAIDWANSTRFALTGAVFSRKQAHLDKAAREFRVGNLYLNRACVGAQVKIQPFGGFHMSGVGTKAGGPAYLLHFMDPRSVTEQPLS